MDNFSTTIKFISKNLPWQECSNGSLASTGDYLWWIIIIAIIMTISAMVYCIYKYKQTVTALHIKPTSSNGFKMFIRKPSSIIMLSIILLLISLLFVCSSYVVSAHANTQGINVSSSINAIADENNHALSIDKATISNDSADTYTLNKIAVSTNDEIINNTNWTIKINDQIIYEGRINQTININEPIEINNTNTISVSTDMDCNDALKLNGKDAVTINYFINKCGLITNLRTDDKIAPNDIDTKTPNFSWNIQNDKGGHTQSAYHLTVFDSNNNLIYDTGKVVGEKGSETSNIVYAGLALKSSQKYSWNVVAWDNFGSLIKSASSTFETALLETNPLQDAQYLSYSDPRINDPHDRNTYNFNIDYDLIIMQKNCHFCFSCVDSKNYAFMHLQASDSVPDKLGASIGFANEGKKTESDIELFSDVSFANDIQNKIINVHMESKIDPTELSKQIITIFFDYGDSKQSNKLQFTFNSENIKKLGRLGIRPNIVRWSNCDEATKITNIKATNNDNTENTKLVYENDFSDGKIGFYHDLTAHLETDENGITWIETGKNTRDGNWEVEPLIEYYNKNGNLPAFRSEFNINSSLKSAKLYTAGLGVYDCYINGQRIYNQTENGPEYYELKSNFTQDDKRHYYLTNDVTPMINNGQNAISAVCADSWWSDRVANYAGKSNAFKCQLVLQYENGSQQIINSNTKTWKTSDSAPITKGDVFAGESYDSNTDTSWQLPGYDDSKWILPVENHEQDGAITSSWKGEKIIVRDDLQRNAQKVQIYKGATGEIPGKSYGKINVLREANADNFALNPGETAIIDFGQNATGWESFIANTNNDNAKLTIRHGEILNVENGEYDYGNFGPAGSCNYFNLRSAKATTELDLKKGIDIKYQPSFSFYGFRYIEITATQTTVIKNLTAKTITSVKKDTGNLKTSSEKVNKLVSNAKWGMYSNYVGVATDCPQRDERQGWLADAQIFSETGMFLGDNKGFLEKFCQDIVDSQIEGGQNDGAFWATAPYAGWGPAYIGDTAWSDAAIIIPYTMYSMYGDTKVVQDCWPAMYKYLTKYLPTLDTETHRGPNIQLGDWHIPDEGFLNRDEIKNVIATEYYLADFQMMIKMADVLGKQQEKQVLVDSYADVRKWFNQHFCSDNGIAYPESQTIAAYALFLDIIDSKTCRDKTIEALKQNVVDFGYKPKTGFLGTRVLLDSFALIGDFDTAYKLLTSQDNPSWLLPVNNGATTFLERWDGYIEGKGYAKSASGDVNWTNSFNHYAYGSVVAWMFKNMLGININEDIVGFKQIELKPHPCKQTNKDIDIHEVSGDHDSQYGKISVYSNYSDTNWIYNFITPANTKTTLTLPKFSFTKFYVNGKEYNNLNIEEDGIQVLYEDETNIVFNISSGSFEVQCTN